MNFMVENKIAEMQKSSLGDNGKEINFQLETLLINDIKFDINSVINIGFWIDDLFKFQECKEE